jgi:hypothetical protein
MVVFDINPNSWPTNRGLLLFVWKGTGLVCTVYREKIKKVAALSCIKNEGLKLVANTFVLPMSVS